MIAQIISTGDEVLLGDIVDTNAAFLSANLKNLGIQVKGIHVVGDDVDAIVTTIEQVSYNTEICIVTGGLGPTSDDLTAFACSKAVNDSLELKEDAMNSMKSFFKKRGFELTKENEKQAFLPTKSSMIINNYGTAPGFHIKVHDCLFFFLPGVPSEMKLMFNNEVAKILKEKFDLNLNILIERLTVFGLGESKVGWLLRDFNKQFPSLRLGFRAAFPVIEVKIVNSEVVKNDDKVNSLMSLAKNWVIDHLENMVVSKRGWSIAKEVGYLLASQKKTLAIAESCTGGLISNMITDVAGSSDYFLFTGVTYTNDAKIKILGVNEQTIIDHGAVHEQTALEMALGVKKTIDADYGISTTGIAGPGGGTKEKPVGMVCIGVAGPSKVDARTFQFSFDDRNKHKMIFAMTALELLRRDLVALSSS